MILIKDRHPELVHSHCEQVHYGKYDTYKGSTPADSQLPAFRKSGKYDTYKGSTRCSNIARCYCVTREI